MSMTLPGPEVAGSAGPALHIPDGFLSAPVATAGYVVFGVALAVALRQTDRKIGPRTVPLMGVMGAFIFAAQMMNFPVAGGTSGHMLGGALAAIVLGPWAAILVMTAVVGLQALLFQDGGLVALGANVVNMGVLTAFVGYGVYHTIRPLGRIIPQATVVAAFAAAWISVEVAALATSLQLVLSDTSPFSVVMPAVLGVHALVGIGEGLITAAAVSFLLATRPDILGVRRTGTVMEGVAG
ncbi:MAG: energy-coupling factor ABC transporter permease [Dehalococcoidia bacterium]